MIRIKVLNASECMVLKNPSHHQDIWDILSYTNTYKKNERLVTTKMSAFDKRNGRFGLGLLNYVTEKLKKKNIEFDIEWLVDPNLKRIKDDVNLFEKTLEDYQKSVLTKLDNGVLRGIIQASTGSGKTTIATSIIKKLNYPKTLIVTVSKTIGHAFKKTIEHDLKIPVGFIGDGIFDPKRITVALYQSLKDKILSEFDDIELLIDDEAHLAIDRKNAIAKRFVNTWYRFGLSATPIKRVQKKQYFIVAGQLGETFVKISDKEADKRIVNDVSAYMFTFKGSLTKYNYSEQYRTDVLLNKERCEHICKMVQFAFKKQNVKNVLLLVDEHKQALLIKSVARKFKIGIPTIAWSGSDNKKIISDINNGKLKLCIATPVFSVGTDIPEVECICLGSSRKSLSNTIQKIGRGRRKTQTKDRMILLDIYDKYNDNFFEEYSKRRMRLYQRNGWLKHHYDSMEDA